ncbi:MAG: hypothetical protein OEZ06_31350 [Myxococcales bacterium]|nr:hypothetical protein [Myxococcales bacterium]
MADSERRRGRRGPRKEPEERKDFLIQARVPRDLQQTLRREAARRRLSVSHLIRNVLEDTFDLVENVVDQVDTLVQDSVDLADQVRRDATKIARSATGLRDRSAAREGRRETPESGAGAAETRAESAAADTAATESPAADNAPAPAPAPAPGPLAHVLAWNRVVLNRDAECARCGAQLARGSQAHLGLSQQPAAPPAWLCDPCLGEL